MRIDVLLFAKARDLAGCEKVTVESEDRPTVGALAQSLFDQYPRLRESGLPLLWAVNDAYVSPDTMIAAGDEVACFPPVSGG